MDVVLNIAAKYGDIFIMGTKITIITSAVATVFGLLLGILLALFRMNLFNFKPLYWLTIIYVEIIRGTPLLLQLFLLYYGIGSLFPGIPGLRESWAWPILRDAWYYAILGLSLSVAGYEGEVMRGAFKAVPHGQLDAKTWNDFFPKLLRVVRASNPTRNVVIGPVGWNNFRELDQLQLPEDDRNLIVTFHYYEPFGFTHQGAGWVAPEFSSLKDVPFGTPEQIAQIGKDFDVVKAWSIKHDRPILLGEFGAYDKAPMAGRVLWTETVSRAAKERGFARAYWQFSSDFLLYDFKKQEWVEPILRAVDPKSEH